MDLAKELSQNQTLLLLMPGAEYNEIIVNVVKELTGKNVCYVTLNKTFDSMKELFKKNKIDTGNFVFIDAISKSMSTKGDQTDSCYFISSPAALTELSLTTSKFLRHNFEYLIFDSLNTLLIYNEKATVEKFISVIMNKIRTSKTKAILYAVNVNEQEEFLKQCCVFTDNVIDLGETK